MKTEFWYLIIGVLLVVVTLTGTLTKRLPVTLAMLYLGAGLILGPLGFGVANVEAIGQAGLLELLSELAVIVSLFTAGLKLRCPFPDKRWGAPLRLAFVSMALTVGLVALSGSQLLGISLGAAVLLGAILAPTDPVLASDVQLESAGDQDKLRFGITGEAGFNDGTAFPFVMLGARPIAPSAGRGGLRSWWRLRRAVRSVGWIRMAGADLQHRSGELYLVSCWLKTPLSHKTPGLKYALQSSPYPAGPWADEGSTVPSVASGPTLNTIAFVWNCCRRAMLDFGRLQRQIQGCRMKTPSA